MARRAACGVLAVIGLVLAAWLWRAQLAIGLDFEGGAMFVVRGGEPDAIFQALHDVGARRFTFEREHLMVPDMTQREADEFQRRIKVEYASVIAPTLAPWMGRPLATAIAVLAGLAWALCAFVRPRIAIAVAGALLTLAGLVALHGAIGGTLSRATYYGAAVAAGAVFASPFGKRGWIAAGVFLGIGFAMLVLGKGPYHAAGRIAVNFIPAWAAIAGLCVWLTAGTRIAPHPTSS
jgi:hypothetical protein